MTPINPIFYETHFQPFIVELLSNIANKIGWVKQENEHHKHADVFLKSLFSETQHNTPRNSSTKAYVAERITIETKPKPDIPKFPFPTF